MSLSKLRLIQKSLNYLAHLFLSFRSEELLMGNFTGDFMSNREVALLPEAYQNGVELHRFIDSYTDNHEEVRKCTSLLHPTQGKYAPVVIDIFFDYILYDQWDKYSKFSFLEFKAKSYQIIKTHLEVFPERASKIALAMANGDFLESYTSIEGLTFTFHRLEKRLKFPSNLAFAVDDLKIHKTEFIKSFNVFFPEIIDVTLDFFHGKNIQIQ